MKISEVLRLNSSIYEISEFKKKNRQKFELFKYISLRTLKSCETANGTLFIIFRFEQSPSSSGTESSASSVP